MDSDQALRLLGKYSRWQIERYLLLAFGFSIPFAWMMMSLVFIGDTPNYRCALPENATLNETIPYTLVDGDVVYEKCQMYANFSVDNTTVPCQYGYWYDPASGYESTLTTEWDLVCGQEWLVELSMTIASLGTMCASIIITRLADLYGRKTMFLICLYSNIVIATVQAFSPHIIFYIVMAFLDGLQQQGTLSASYGLALELFPADQRTFAGNAVEFFFAFGYMSVAAIAYFVRNWRHLLLTITLPLSWTVCYYWLVSESIPWLVSNDRKDEAETILKKAAKRNKITLPENIFRDDTSLSMGLLGDQKEIDGHVGNSKDDAAPDEISANGDNQSYSTATQQTGTTSTKYTIWDIFKSKILLKYSLVQFSIWFTIALAYSSVNLTVTYLPGNRYLNTFLYAATEIPAYIIAWVLCEKVGRRLPLVYFNVIAGVAYVGTLIQIFEVSFNMTPLLITLNMIGKTMITASFAVIYVMAPEIYPTNLRVIGLGLCQFFARIGGGVVGPFARILTRHYPALTPIIIGVLSISVGFMALLLPETRNRKLPDTIYEIEQWSKPKEHRAESTEPI